MRALNAYTARLREAARDVQRFIGREVAPDWQELEVLRQKARSMLTGFVEVGTALDSRNTLRAFKALLTDAELPAIRLHDLRYSCATLLLAQGVNPRVVQEVLGHSAITLTLGTYRHVLPALAEEAAAKIDGALSR